MSEPPGPKEVTMKTLAIEKARIGLLLLVLIAANPATVHAQNNSWTNGLPGNWGDAANWSFGAPAVGEDLYITNIPGKTVSIGGTVLTNTLTVSSVTIGAPGPAINTLLLTNAGTNIPLHVVASLSMLAGGNVTLTNSR